MTYLRAQSCNLHYFELIKSMSEFHSFIQSSNDAIEQ